MNPFSSYWKYKCSVFVVEIRMISPSYGTPFCHTWKRWKITCIEEAPTSFIAVCSSECLELGTVE